MSKHVRRGVDASGVVACRLEAGLEAGRRPDACARRHGWIRHHHRLDSMGHVHQRIACRLRRRRRWRRYLRPLGRQWGLVGGRVLWRVLRGVGELEQARRHVVRRRRRMHRVVVRAEQLRMGRRRRLRVGSNLLEAVGGVMSIGLRRAWCRQRLHLAGRHVGRERQLREAADLLSDASIGKIVINRCGLRLGGGLGGGDVSRLVGGALDQHHLAPQMRRGGPHRERRRRIIVGALCRRIEGTIRPGDESETSAQPEGVVHAVRALAVAADARAGVGLAARHALEPQPGAAGAFTIREDGTACHLGRMARVARSLSRPVAVGGAVEAEAAAAGARPRVRARRLRLAAVHARVEES